MTKKLPIIIASIVVVILITVYIVSYNQYGSVSGVNKRTYECDYHTISLRTKITTTINNEPVEISGNLITVITDPLTMTDSKGNKIAYADDSYHLISQDDHNIIVNGKFEIGVKGNVDFIGESYELFDNNGNIIGRAAFSAFAKSGAIYDINDTMIASFSSGFLKNDYTVEICDNKVCSDIAILMIIASYVSDYHADTNN